MNIEDMKKGYTWFAFLFRSVALQGNVFLHISLLKIMKSDRWYILIILTFLIWGTQHPCLKLLSDELPPLLINLVRFSMILLVLLPFVAAQKIVSTKRDVLKMAALGLLGIALYGFLVVSGLRRSTSINGSILLNTHPLIAAIVAPYLVKETFHLRGVFGIITGFAGMMLVILQGFQFQSVVDIRYLGGNLLLFLAAICLALYAVCSKFLVPRYGSLVTTFYAVLAGTVVLLAGAGVSGEIFQIGALSRKHLLLLVYVAVMTTALTWVVWFKAIQKLGVFKAEPLFFLLPVSGMLSARIFLGEQLSGISVVGIIFILTGIYMVQKEARIRKQDSLDVAETADEQTGLLESEFHQLQEGR